MAFIFIITREQYAIIVFSNSVKKVRATLKIFKVNEILQIKFFFLITKEIHFYKMSVQKKN